MKRQALVIGAGGIGMPLCLRLIHLFDLVSVYDGDVFEEKNMGRQLNNRSYVGKSKVELLHTLAPDISTHSWNFIDGESLTWGRNKKRAEEYSLTVFLAVDNAAARKLIWDWVNSPYLPYRPDMVITGANEFNTGEAYVWIPSLSPHLIPDPATAFPMAWHGGAADEAAPHCHELEKSAGGEQLAAVNMTVAGDMVFLAQAWKNLTENPDLIMAGVDLPWCVRTSLIRKDVDYVRFTTPSLDPSEVDKQTPDQE